MKKAHESLCMDIIVNAGTSKSMYLEAISLTKKNETTLVVDKLKKADEHFIKAHRAHGELLVLEANNDTIEVNLLLIHAEDQLSNCETVKILSQEIIDLYKIAY